MLMCKQAEKGVPLRAEQSNWLDDMDEEIDEQELETHYSFIAKILDVLTAKSGSDVEPLEKVQSDAEYNVFVNKRQHSEQPKSISDTYVVEKDDSNVIPDSSDMCVNDNQADQNNEECDDERVVLTNLIANLKLDTDENKNIQKQLKKANTSHTHELQECKSALEKCKSSLEESNRTRYKYLGALNDQVVELAKYKRLNDCTLENDRLERKLKETLGLLAQKEIDSKEVLKTKGYEISVEKEKNNKLVKQSSLTTSRYESLIKEKNKVIQGFRTRQDKDIDKVISLEKQVKFLNDIVYKIHQWVLTIHMLAPKPRSIYNGRPSFANPKYPEKAQSEKPCLYAIPYEKNDLANIFAPDREGTLTLEQESRSKLHNEIVNPYDTQSKTVFMKFLNHQHRHILISCGVIHTTSVSRPRLRNTQMKEKVTHNNSQVKFKKTEVEDHHRISSISNKTKSVIACNDSLKSKTSNVNAVCATCGKCVFDSHHDACVSKFINDVNARTKKLKVVPISTRKPKRQANKAVATPHKKIVTSDSTIQKSKSNFRMLYKNTNKSWKWWIEKQCPSGYNWTPKTKKKWDLKLGKTLCQQALVPL
ncbi:hypothetical protein Tco_1074363 [Tanacetum coccineum]